MPIGALSPENWICRIRGHWGGIEIRNHWRKDACLLEDMTRSINSTIVVSLSMLRNVVLHFFTAQTKEKTLNGFVEDVAADSTKAFAMLKASS